MQIVVALCTKLWLFYTKHAILNPNLGDPMVSTMRMIRILTTLLATMLSTVAFAQGTSPLYYPQSYTALDDRGEFTPLDDRWYLVPTVSFNELFSDVHGVGGQLAIGRALSQQFSLELRAVGTTFLQGNEFERIGGGLDALFFLDRGTPFEPFLLAGVGGADFTVGDNSQAVLLADAGAGFNYKLSDRLSLRGDVRYRLNSDFDNINRNELVVNAGVVIPLGSLAKPAAPVVAAAPAPDPCAADDDQDGVNNCLDKCPSTLTGSKVDALGCPVPQTLVLPNIYFAYDSAELLPASADILDKVVAELKESPNLLIEVGGHASSEGPDRYNLKLTQRRAESVVNYLREHEVTNSLTARGYGESLPIADNSTEAGREKNRRVELTILK